MSLDRHLQRGKVNGPRKSLFTLSVTLAFTPANEQSPGKRELRTTEWAKWPRNGTVLGWSDPTFVNGYVPKLSRGSLQPNKRLPWVRAVRIWAKQVKKIGITYFSFVFTIFFSL